MVLDWVDQVGVPDISETFDRVVVVNLARRPERMERFWQVLGDWPFARPERFEAIDGSAVPVPGEWKRGPGAWGCMLSHRAVMRQAIEDGLTSILVLEDDAIPVPNFSQRAADFLARVPNDWDCLMLGAEHLRPPTPIVPGIVRCNRSNRTHAFAIRGRMMHALLNLWQVIKNDHCDIVLAALMRYFNAYAPDPFLIGQDSGYSDITDRKERLRFLSTQQTEIFAARDSRYRIERLVAARIAGPHPLAAHLENERELIPAPKVA